MHNSSIGRLLLIICNVNIFLPFVTPDKPSDFKVDACAIPINLRLSGNLKRFIFTKYFIFQNAFITSQAIR